MQLHGLEAAKNKKSAGNCVWYKALEILINFWSKITLRASRVFCENSPSSSKKSKPLWAKEITPGNIPEPPPTSPMVEIV